MTLTWYGHSCFLLTSGEGSIVFDPYAPLSVPGWELPALRADSVICSHGHRDHGWSAGVGLTGGRFTGKIEQIASFHDEKRGALRGENLIAWEITKALAPKIVIPMHYRGADFGYDVIGPVEPFLSLAGNVKKLDGMSYTVALSDAPATVVFGRA